MFCVSFIVAFNAEKLDQPFTEDKKKRIFRQINLTWLLVLILVILAFYKPKLEKLPVRLLFSSDKL